MNRSLWVIPIFVVSTQRLFAGKRMINYCYYWGMRDWHGTRIVVTVLSRHVATSTVCRSRIAEEMINGGVVVETM